MEVNSNKRAQAVKRKIQSALGTEARFVTKVTETIEENIGRGHKEPDRGSSAIRLDQLPLEALEAFKKMADAHWTKWFDDKIPALNGLTPKQATKTREGRELLEALLNFYEQKSDLTANPGTNLFQPDFHELRKKLGLT